MLREWTEALPPGATIAIEGDRVVAKTDDGRTIAPAPGASIQLAAIRDRRRKANEQARANRATND